MQPPTFHSRTCKVRDCTLHTAGELVLWSADDRQPVVAPLCTLHLGQAADALANVISRKATPATG